MDILHTTPTSSVPSMPLSHGESIALADGIIEWNRERGKLEAPANFWLELKMLAEELLEVATAKTLPHRLQEISDVSFVGVGTEAKMEHCPNLTDEERGTFKQLTSGINEVLLAVVEQAERDAYVQSSLPCGGFVSALQGACFIVCRANQKKPIVKGTAKCPKGEQHTDPLTEIEDWMKEVGLYG